MKVEKEKIEFLEERLNLRGLQVNDDCAVLLAKKMEKLGWVIVSVPKDPTVEPVEWICSYFREKADGKPEVSGEKDSAGTDLVPLIFHATYYTLKSATQ